MQKHKRRPTRWMKYKEGLRLLGFHDYDSYLRSEYWSAFNEWYNASDLPKKCTVCGSLNYELHHIRYDRIGCEMLSDVIPLCREHHQQVHSWLLEHPSVPLHHVDVQLSQCFGLDWQRCQSVRRHLAWLEKKCSKAGKTRGKKKSRRA